MAVSVRFTAIVPKGRRRGFNDAVRKQLTAYTEQFANRIVTEMKKYPPPPPDSRYERTYTLQRNWQVRRAGTPPNIGRAIVNTTPYAAGVVGTVTDPGRQWWMHERTGWQTLAEVVQRLGGRNKFRHDTQAIITREAREGVF